MQKVIRSKTTKLLAGLTLLVLVLNVPSMVFTAWADVKLGNAVTGITADGASEATVISGHDGRQVGMQVWGTFDGATATPEMRLCDTCSWVQIPNSTATTDASAIFGPVWAYSGTEFRITVSGAGGSTALSYIVRK